MSLEPNMSTENTPVVSAAKTRLPAKMQRHMVFVFWYVNKLRETGVLADDAASLAAFHSAKLFDSVDQQIELLNEFETDLKTNTKTLRKQIADFHKPPKPAKAPKVSDAKRGRKKKIVDVRVDNNDDLISQLVAAANAGEPTALPSVEVEAEVAEVEAEVEE